MNNTNPKALELGCGWGYHTDYLRRNGIDVDGLDFSKNFIKIAKKEFPLSTYKNINALSLMKHYKKKCRWCIRDLFLSFYTKRKD